MARKITPRHRVEEIKAAEAAAKAEATRKSLEREKQRQKNIAADTGMRPGAEEFGGNSDPRLTEFMYPMNTHGTEGVPNLLSFMPETIERTIVERAGEAPNITLSANLQGDGARNLEVLHRQYVERTESSRFVPGVLVLYEGTLYALEEFSYENPVFADMTTLGGRSRRIMAEDCRATVRFRAIPERIVMKRGS